jgi:hypothetical protein
LSKEQWAQKVYSGHSYNVNLLLSTVGEGNFEHLSNFAANLKIGGILFPPVFLAL